MIKLNSHHFKGQRRGENVLLITHRHWFNIAIQFFYIVAMLAFVVLIYSIAPALFPEAEKNSMLVLNFFVSFFLMLLWLFTSTIWIDYYLDVWIITDQRLINIEQKGLFSRERSELEYTKIQDITTDIKGIIPTFLNYGNVNIQTAAEIDRFNFQAVPDPSTIKNLVSQLQKAQEKEETDELGEIIKKTIRK